eukprot:scaffold160452_cov36-Tisochrysis_lutea.AAC.1
MAKFDNAVPGLQEEPYETPDVQRPAETAGTSDSPLAGMSATPADEASLRHCQISRATIFHQKRGPKKHLTTPYIAVAVQQGIQVDAASEAAAKTSAESSAFMGTVKRNPCELFVIAATEESQPEHLAPTSSVSDQPTCHRKKDESCNHSPRAQPLQMHARHWFWLFSLLTLSMVLMISFPTYNVEVLAKTSKVPEDNFKVGNFEHFVKRLQLPMFAQTSRRRDKMLKGNRPAQQQHSWGMCHASLASRGHLLHSMLRRSLMSLFSAIPRICNLFVDRGNFRPRPT